MKGGPIGVLQPPALEVGLNNRTGLRDSRRDGHVDKVADPGDLRDAPFWMALAALYYRQGENETNIL